MKITKFEAQNGSKQVLSDKIEKVDMGNTNERDSINLKKEKKWGKKFVSFLRSIKGIIVITGLVITILGTIYSLKDSDSFNKDIQEINKIETVTDSIKSKAN